MLESLALELSVAHWFNTDQPITLESLRDKVVVIEAFQMLCPGCVAHGLPQASLIAKTFSTQQVQVIGLHTVFEHHDVQGSQAALAAFIHEYRLEFPIAIDVHEQGSAIPKTMRALNLRGTPSLVIIDRMGIVRHNHFGRPADMAIGAQIMGLTMKSSDESGTASSKTRETDVCPIEGECG